jgi:hypothetical protein
MPHIFALSLKWIKQAWFQARRDCVRKVKNALGADEDRNEKL